MSKTDTEKFVWGRKKKTWEEKKKIRNFQSCDKQSEI